jgi:hypothetical protein
VKRLRWGIYHIRSNVTPIPLRPSFGFRADRRFKPLPKRSVFGLGLGSCGKEIQQAKLDQLGMNRNGASGGCRLEGLILALTSKIEVPDPTIALADVSNLKLGNFSPPGTAKERNQRKPESRLPSPTLRSFALSKYRGCEQPSQLF